MNSLKLFNFLSITVYLGEKSNPKVLVKQSINDSNELNFSIKTYIFLGIHPYFE